METLPWDSLFAAAFAYSGYRTVGRWFKYTDDTAKAQSDGAYLEGFREFLADAAAAGERDKPNPGAGADACGQGHLWRDWGGMKTKQRLALLSEMQKVLEWTGQDKAFRQLAKHRGKAWSQLPHGAKKALLAAADQLDWSFLAEMAADGAAVAKSTSLWQVNEAVPLLSAEPALAEALLEEGAGLQELVNSADLAVNALLSSQQEAAIASLAPAQELQVAEARRKVELLREAAQGGLGLGSGGKAARGQKLLELLRGISLAPVQPADQDAKAAASAALDAAADEAVSPLKQQQATALAAALATARTQALGNALAGFIRHGAGRPPLTPAAAAGVVGVAADEVAAALAALGAAEGLVARRGAAESLMGMASIIDSAAAALAAAAGDGDDAGLQDALAVLSEAGEKLQEACIKVAEMKLKGAAAKPPEGEEAAEAAEDKEAAAVAAVEEALAATRAAAAALPAAPAAGEATEEGAEAPATGESVREAVFKEVDDRVAVQEEKTKQQQETALQNARSRERMSVLLAKAKRLMGAPAEPAAAAAAAAPADGEQPATEEAEAAAAPEPPMPPAERLAVAEEFLQQLGTRPLAAALSDLHTLIEAQGAGGDGAAGAAALAAGVALSPEGEAALSRLGDILSEIELADAVISLELGSGVSKTLASLRAYLDRLGERHSAAEARAEGGGEGDGDGGADGVSTATTPRLLGLSPDLARERDNADRCAALVDELARDGLVALGLTSAQYRQLGVLKEAVAALSPSMDGLKYDRCVAALKEVSSQLGPIGAAIQVKLADTTDPELRELMAKQKALALDLYSHIQAFLSFEEGSRAPLKSCLRELSVLAGGIGAPRTPSGCTTAGVKLYMAVDDGQKLQDLLAALATSKGEVAGGEGEPVAPDSVAATQQVVESLQGTLEAMQASLADLSAHVVLRGRALDPEVAASAAAAGLEGDDLGLGTLQDMEPELNHPLTILSAASEEQQAEWEAVGLEQIARGRVAAVLIATAAADGAHAHPADGGAKPAPAGAGSEPRAALPVPGLPSGKSVLQLVAERILRLQKLAASATFGRNAPVTRHLHWYIMTSPSTHGALASLLKDHGHFGLSPSQVHLFTCAAAPPAFAGDPLRAVQVGPSTLTRGQPGSGEVFAALKAAGALAHMRRAGVRHVEINAVDDNVLARPADPVLVGFAATSGLDAVAKVAEPQSFAAAYAAAMSGGEDAQQQQQQGGAGEGEGEGAEEERQRRAAELLDEEVGFLAPAIGSYYFTHGALSRAAAHCEADPLALYRLVPAARLPSKAPPPALSVNLPPNATQAQRMQAQQALLAAQQAAAAAPPKPVEGWVPTRHISDVFCSAGGPGSPSAAPAGAGGPSGPLAGARMAYLAVEREEEFSSVLGGGPHLAVPEPEHAAGDLLALTTGWVESHGAVVECEEGVEVSPLVSYAGEGLEVLAGEGTVFAEPYDLALQGATGEGRPRHNAGPWAAPVLLAYAVGAGLAVAKQLAAGRK